MAKFTFLFHDGGKIVFDARKCKHYSGHAALDDVTVLENTRNYSIKVGEKFIRFNIALNDNLFGMIPSDVEADK